MQRRILDLKTASEEHCVSRRKLWNLISSGRLSAYKFDGKIFVKPEDLYRLLTAEQYEPPLDKLVNETLAELGGGK